MQLISATALLGFPDLVGDLGGDPDALLHEVGLRRTDCGNGAAFISLRSGIRAIEGAATATSTPDFGRRLAERQGIEILGALGLAARTAATLGDALVVFDRFMRAYSAGLSVPMRPVADSACTFFEWRLLLRPTMRHAQTTELSLGIMLRVLRALIGVAYTPVSVHFSHDPLTDRRDYVIAYGCRPLFAQPAAGFTLLTADLGRPLRHDPVLHHAAVEQLDAQVGRRSSTTAGSVADLVAPLLPGGPITVDFVAEQFSVHPKALQRSLSGEGTSFTAIIDNVRREIAERLLRDTEMCMTQVTRQLGFAEQSVLTRACRRWFDASPSDFRAAQRA